MTARQQGHETAGISTVSFVLSASGNVFVVFCLWFIEVFTARQKVNGTLDVSMEPQVACLLDRVFGKLSPVEVTYL